MHCRKNSGCKSSNENNKLIIKTETFNYEAITLANSSKITNNCKNTDLFLRQIGRIFFEAFMASSEKRF